MAVQLPMFVVDMRNGEWKSVGGVGWYRHWVAGGAQWLSVRGWRWAIVVDGRRVVACVGKTVQVAAGRSLHSARPWCRLCLAIKQSPRLADVISAEIQHGRLTTSGVAPTDLEYRRVDGSKCITPKFLWNVFTCCNSSIRTICTNEENTQRWPTKWRLITVSICCLLHDVITRWIRLDDHMATPTGLIVVADWCQSCMTPRPLLRCIKTLCFNIFATDGVQQSSNCYFLPAKRSASCSY